MIQHFPGIGEPFITLSEVDSSNNYAMARITEGPITEGTTWFAWSQTSGKGQRGNQWQSEPGENVMMSVVLKPVKLRPAEQFMLSASMALALLDLVREYAGSEAHIKWSNDLYIGDKKAGGILIENVIRGNTWNDAIVGIGLNVNQEAFGEDLPNPVSLRQATGVRYDVLALARELCRCIGRRYAGLSPENFNNILAEYTRSLYRLGSEQLFRAGKDFFRAKILGVDEDGKLLLLKDSREIKLDFGAAAFVVNGGGHPDTPPAM